MMLSFLELLRMCMGVPSPAECFNIIVQLEIRPGQNPKHGREHLAD